MKVVAILPGSFPGRVAAGVPSEVVRVRVRCVCVGVLILAAMWPSRSFAQTSSSPEPEEPDFAFISGSAYTQVKKSVQFIHATSFGTRRFTVLGGRRNEDQFLFFQREEYGVTDRMELDVVTPGAGSRERLNGTVVNSDYGFADSLIGVRYRFLSEEKNAPLTLTMGPQLLLPSGSVPKGTGQGSIGFAWDVAVSRDWRGPFFLYNTLNYHVLPAGKDPTPGSTEGFALHGINWATALGIRALEHPSGGSKHDIHAFFEAGGSWEQGVEPGAVVGTRRGELAWVFSPGVRYGFITSRKTLTEIGVSFPIGLGPNGPKRGIIIQFQFERVFGKRQD